MEIITDLDIYLFYKRILLILLFTIFLRIFSEEKNKNQVFRCFLRVNVTCMANFRLNFIK